MDYAPDVGQLRSRSNQALYEFLITDLGLCETFVSLAETEIGMADYQQAERLLTKAWRGVEVITGFLPKLIDDDQQTEVESRLNGLSKSLQVVQENLAARAANPPQQPGAPV